MSSESHADKSSSLSQVDICEENAGTKDFVSYRSPLSSYPLLCANSQEFLSDTTFPRAMDNSFPFVDTYSGARTDSVDPHVLIGVNLRSMKTAAVNRWLSDPSRRVCQYEVPGGGECRDPTCQDIHPSLAWTVEPSGTPSFSYSIGAHVFILSSPILILHSSPVLHIVLSPL